MLQYRLALLGLTAEEALTELKTTYEVYLRDSREGFKLSRVVTMTKKQESILKAVDRNLVKMQ